MTNDDLIFAEVVNVDKSFTTDLISRIINITADGYLIKTVILFHPEGKIREYSTSYNYHSCINFKRWLKCNNGYLNFEFQRDYDIYVLYKKLINSFLKNNPVYKMVGDEFGIINWCFSTDVVFEFAHEPELV